MNIKSIFKNLLKIKGVFIEGARLENGALVVNVRQHKRESLRCPICGRKAKRYDSGRGKRRWRALDFGIVKVFIEADICRIRCKKHGVLTEQVSWARHGSAFTRDFEETAAWLSLHCAKTVVSVLMRISWNTVGPIVKRVSDELEAAGPSRFDGLECIGIDETSYKKGHKYMTVIADHKTGKLIWAAVGYGKEVLERFFKGLTKEQCASIKHITADGAKWIAETGQKYCPNAERSIDPFHVVEWANGVLDEVRKRIYRETAEKVKADKGLDKGERKEAMAPVTEAKYAMLKNPETLTEGQLAKVELIAKSTPQLYRAYLLKEKLRLLFKHTLAEAADELQRWLSWAQRCRIPEFRELRNKIKRHKDAILSTIKYGLSNSLVEAINNKIKLTIRMAYGFRNTDNMLALVMLRCSGVIVNLPGRPILAHTS
jgi:transposase